MQKLDFKLERDTFQYCFNIAEMIHESNKDNHDLCNTINTYIPFHYMNIQAHLDNTEHQSIASGPLEHFSSIENKLKTSFPHKVNILFLA